MGSVSVRFDFVFGGEIAIHWSFTDLLPPTFYWNRNRFSSHHSKLLGTLEFQSHREHSVLETSAPSKVAWVGTQQPCLQTHKDKQADKAEELTQIRQWHRSFLRSTLLEQAER